ncbi:MAG: 5-guanidino-2-oxopentanoate decarboxylase [Steroidobacteraceae bacterium]|jgi:acetolactate synthase-1/2/3 large subunit
MLTCGELLVKLLEDFGVDTVFGIPGVHTVELYRGLPSTRIRHITPRHEQGAGFMADGYARVSGKPGVCFIITGPGMTNIMTAMAQSYGDSIPMLVISSVNNTEQLGMGGGRLHELPSQCRLTSGVTAFSHTLMRPDELPAVLTRAFAVFGSARPRPVHIEIPINVITAPADHVGRKLGAIPSRPAASPAAISRAVELLKAARRPVVFLGGGASHAAAEARQLVEALDAPTACTINAKGILPKGHPLSLGSNTSLRPVRDLVLASDVVLAVGTEMGETDYDLVFDGNLRIHCPLIRIDIDPEQINRNFPSDVAIVSDARMAIGAILAQIGERGVDSGESRGAKLTAKVRARLDAEWPAAWKGQRRTLETLQEALPEVIIVGDSTQPVYSGNHLFEPSAPHSWFNSATGYGTLGYGLPAAVGAKLAAPARPVVALIGDGGLQFTLPELASAIEARAPIIVLLWNNEGYGEIKRYMQERGIPTIGVDIYTPDLLGIARGFGCSAARASSFAHLRELLQEAARADRPTVVEVREDAGFLHA